jgi:trk system potassium uptake protein TrkA
MNMIIIGCGRVGAELAYRLFQKGHRVSVIDTNQNAFTSLPPDFLGRTIEGEALNQDILHRAGVEEADGLACVTGSDPLNAVVAHIARVIYKVPNVISRNYDPAFREMHEAFGLQTVSSSSWGAQRIEELMIHAEMRTVYSAGNGEVEIYEVGIPATLNGQPLKNILPAHNCCPVSLTRAGKAMLVDPNTLLQESDLLLVSATFEGIEEVRSQISAAREG